MGNSFFKNDSKRALVNCLLFGSDIGDGMILYSPTDGASISLDSQRPSARGGGSMQYHCLDFSKCGLELEDGSGELISSIEVMCKDWFGNAGTSYDPISPSGKLRNPSLERSVIEWLSRQQNRGRNESYNPRNTFE